MEHRYQPNEGWFACNIRDIDKYISYLQIRCGGELTPTRLKEAVDEDTFGAISVKECQELLHQQDRGFNT